MDKKQRRQHSPEDKVRILRLHLLEHKPVSALCEEEGIHPTLFYQWQKAFFENGAAAFSRSSRPDSAQRRDQLVESLEAKLKRKDEVIAIIAEDLIREKKTNGAS
jgi:transposase-like protein